MKIIKTTKFDKIGSDLRDSVSPAPDLFDSSHSLMSPTSEDTLIDYKKKRFKKKKKLPPADLI